LSTLKVTFMNVPIECVALVSKLANALERPLVPELMLVGLNPLVLVYGVGGAHNDAFMLLLVLAGMLWAVRSRPALSGAALVGAAAVKVTGGLVLPFLFIASREKRRVALGAAAAGAGVLVLVAVLFRSNVGAALTPFSDQGNATSLRSFPGQVSQAFLGLHVVSPTVQALAEVALVLV